MTGRPSHATATRSLPRCHRSLHRTGPGRLSRRRRSCPRGQPRLLRRIRQSRVQAASESSWLLVSPSHYSRPAPTAAVLTSGGSPQRPGQTHPSVTPVDLSASYTFSDARRGALTASRAWKLDATGRTVSGTTTIRNNAAKVARVVDIEVIPKSIATNVGSLTFSRPPTHVIQSDPVVQFTVAVRPHSKVAIHWDARLTSTAQPTLLSRAAAVKKSAEKALTTSRLRTLGQRWGFRAASVVPFATRRDPGLTTTTPPATPSPRGSATATSTDGPVPTLTTPPANNTQTTPGRTTNLAPSLAAIARRTSNEQSSVSVQLSGRDPEGAALTYVRVGGSLPPGVSLSSRTGAISGRIPYNAVNRTSSWSNIASSTYTATFAVSDGHKQSSAQTLTWTVRDTYTTMPNYYHDDGAVHPTVGQLLTAANRDPRCHIGTDSSQDAFWAPSGDRIWRQSVAA